MKVFVSGCFDMLHCGHVAFLNEAARYGDLYVAIGSDRTIEYLKGRKAVNSEYERKFMINNLKCVESCFVSSGTGYIDFSKELKEVSPDIFIVEGDGDSPEKQSLCKQLNIEYRVINEISDIFPRHTSDFRKINSLPYRIDIAGTWIDQPYVSKFYPGGAIVCSLEPTVEFNDRSGMATSTRKKALELWPMGIPMGNPEKLAEILFRYDNPPEQQEVSGSQDSLGMVLPGVNFIYYDRGQYWPSRIEGLSEDVIGWLEKRMYFTFLWPRPQGFNVLKGSHINKHNVRELSDSAINCWYALQDKDFGNFSWHVLKSFEAQTKLFPRMINNNIKKVIDKYKKYAYKLAGAGGGGYLILFSEEPIDGVFKIKIRRKNGYK